MFRRMACPVAIFSCLVLMCNTSKAQWFPLRFDIQYPTYEHTQPKALDLEAWGYANSGWHVKVEVERNGQVIASADSGGPLPAESSSGGGGGYWAFNLPAPQGSWYGGSWTGSESWASLEMKLYTRMESSDPWGDPIDSVTFDSE